MKEFFIIIINNITSVAFLKRHYELIAAVFSGLLILVAWLTKHNIPHTLWIILMLTAFIVGGYAKAKEGIYDTFQHRTLNVELLMILAAIGSASIGYWEEGAILIFIFSLSGALETYTMQKSEKELSSLIKLQPKQALMIRNGVEQLVPVNELRIDDTILIKPGERVPADGKIEKGTSSLDESPLTGEPFPVTKGKNEEVYAGTVNLNGSLYIKITKQSKDSFVQQIIELVQTAQQQKSPSQLFIERFESTYVKVVLISVGIMLFLPHYLVGWSWVDTFYRAMVLLVVASPCALVASIMPASLSAISNGARNGILFKGGVHIEQLSKINAIAFDKTGTLTNGKPTVTDTFFDPSVNTEEVLSIIATIEKESNHPLAEAIVTYCRTYNIKSDLPLDHMREESGKGVYATYGDNRWVIGSEKLFTKNDQSLSFIEQGEAFAKQAKSIVYIGKDEKIIGLIALKDEVRQDTKQAIQAFKKAGIYTVMLTGDNDSTAQAIAQETTIDSFIALCMPKDKQEHINKLRQTHDSIAMIGDGINDAPALATADVGIAMGAGTDVSIEAADIILMKNQLNKIVHARQLSKRMNRIVKQNIFFSISVILTLILANFTQWIDLPLGVIGHEGSTILVILNGLRLLK
ncbi:Zinc-transporting ATPase [Paraliobacillus sp. PM-2]|uniref:heavy metal translocating P-type ATPase n=1 Tax=Paraliobacillus sp. PM-2 TaxID=1462524 RepID=UPI00061B8B6F|nr:heavy metal translocating P-type ATPase [Paraliobacillus sp. PM-2]CQR47277.1 Zinc-transporting ATPase [Paraliobacillus sp. PM-2]